MLWWGDFIILHDEELVLEKWLLTWIDILECYYSILCGCKSFVAESTTEIARVYLSSVLWRWYCFRSGPTLTTTIGPLKL